MPLTDDSISVGDLMRLLMPKSLSLTHQSFWGGCDLTNTFYRLLLVGLRTGLGREGVGTYSWLDVTVGEALAVHVVQSL